MAELTGVERCHQRLAKQLDLETVPSSELELPPEDCTMARQPQPYPFCFGDQPFWGNMVAATGAGHVPISQKKLTIDNLAEAIRYCQSPQASRAANEISERMRIESDIEAAVASFHKSLPLEKISCHLFPDQPAVWKYSKGKQRIKLSNLDAQCTVSKLRINRNRATSAYIGTISDVTRATTGILIDRYQEYRKGQATLTTSHAQAGGSHTPLTH
ncbi:sterol glucosyltransferase [Diplodia corticola]|uniref:Sterol glucosyltransferase n=1 Tax=Diplodia corticola TaxID=236234 RepID=A0A1J9QZK4_9PEZI|nr:sterol glucosyltransferase [Diplodia corticola]OJD33418.1 sterol glucosyltransferase [Diplodia corticola]